MSKADGPGRLDPIPEKPAGARGRLRVPLAVATAYYLAAQLGFVLRFPPATTSVLWPPNALLTAALLLVPPRLWAGCLLAVFPAHLLVEIQAGLPLPLVLALLVTNCGEALLAATLVRRWSDAPDRFDSLRRITAFLAAAVVVAPLVTTFADAAAVHGLVGEEYWPVFWRRLLANALSALTIIPSAVTFIRRGLGRFRGASPTRWLEAGFLATSTAAIAATVFSREPTGSPGLPGVPYTLLPFLVPVLMWAAVRFGPGGLSFALLATALIAIRAAVLGSRPMGLLTPAQSTEALQIFITVVGVPLLYLGALIEERRQVVAALRERLRFEKLLSGLSAAFVHPPTDQVDQAFILALRQLGEFTGVDRITIRRFAADGALDVAYAWLAVGTPSPPGPLHRSEIAWAADRLWAKQVVVIPAVAHLPDEASVERQLLLAHGVQSLLVVPLVAGEQVFGALGFVATSAPRAWAPAFVEQSLLIADVFANALARKQAEEAVRRTEDTKTAVLASLTSYVAVLDRAGRIVTVNESWAQRAATGGGESLGVVGSDHLDMWRRLAAAGMTDAETVVAGLSQILDGTRQSFLLEYPSATEPGSWYLKTVVPLRAPEGGAVVSITDVTERKLMTLEAQKSRQELAHFLRVSTIGELTTSLAHELNQPLTAILANAQAGSRLLRDSVAPGSGEIREILADIADEGRRAGEVIQGLRVLLRKGEPNLALIEVNSMVREVIDLLRSDALIRGVQVQVDLDSGQPTVRGDRVQLQQVLLNLLLNSLEAMVDEGENDRVVQVHTESDEGSTVRVSVIDSGPGLRLPVSGDVFEPFYTTKATGLGMGLSIARSITGAHGGTVEARNNPGRGATFTVILPSPNAAPSRAGTAQASGAP